MGNKYNEQDINRFFENLKNLKNTYDLEKVHRLINNPDAKATQKVKFYYKPLNFIIMTSIIMILVSAVLFWPEAEINDKTGNLETSYSSLKINQEQNSNPVKNKNVQSKDSILLETKQFNRKQKKKEIQNNEETEISKPVEVKKEKELQKKITQEHNIVLAEDSIDSCEWPVDTVIDKNLLLVTLTNEELLKLGVVIKGEGVYYNNKKTSVTFHVNQIPEKDRKTTNYEFRRVFTSNLNYEPFFPFDRFYSSIDTLVPVIITSINQIWWFNPHETLFEALPPRYLHLKRVYENILCLKKRFPKQNFTYYPGGVENEIINAFELDKSELKEIGVNIVDRCIILISKNGRRRATHGFQNNRKLNFEEPDIVKITEESFPVFRTDTLGRRVLLPTSNARIKNDSIHRLMDLLVPIKIDAKKLVGTQSPNSIWIWWFYPTDEFVDALPERIKHDLKLERDAIINNTPNKSGSCNYFEACKSTLWLDDLSIYPNPVNETVRIDFSLDEAIDGRISLVNISGSVLKVIVPQTTFMAGLNSFEANLSDVSPGIYLISINTKNGFKTQRVIVSR